MSFETQFIKTLKFILHSFYSPIFLIICSGVIHFTQGQNNDIPSLDDPFFGQEPSPDLPKTPYQGCPAECDTRLIQAMANIADLERRITTLNITVTSRLNNVPTSGGGGTGTSDELTNRVINVENYLYGNMTSVANQLTSDLAVAQSTLTQNMTDTRNYLEGRIAAISSGGTPSDNTSPDVYSNITARLNNLENNKVQTLIDENNVWRRNFEVVNKTFSKMKKSSYSNEVIVVG